jgi:two-component system OmpR family response regulator
MPEVEDVLLVVEDQSEVRETLGTMLRKAGFDVVLASDGHEALTLLAEGLVPRAILLDLWMPVMDGWEFLDKARPAVPVIVVSGIGEPVYPLPRSVVKVLTKPIGIQDLVTAVKNLRTAGQ